MNDTDKPKEGEGYTKVDKRFTKTEGGGPAQPSTETASQPPSETPAEPSAEATSETDAKVAEEKQGEKGQPEPQSFAELGVYAVIRFALSLLIQQAWIALGILAPPGGETKMNLPEAKVAIDTAAVLVDKLQPDLDDAEKRELEATLANLRVNYVQRAG